MKTYAITFKGERLLVDAIRGPGARVQVFSIVRPDARDPVTFHDKHRTARDGSDDKPSALETWPAADRLALYLLVRAAP